MSGEITNVRIHRIGVELRRLQANSQRPDQAMTARLIEELKTAFRAVAGYELLAYVPAAEQPDGWDLIVEDADRPVSLLLRTTAPCVVRRYLVNPDHGDRELFGFSTNTVDGAGRAGGVLLVSERSSGGLEIRYADIEVLSTLWLGIIKLPKRSITAVAGLRKAMTAGHVGMIRMPVCAFVTARSPSSLIDLVGVESWKSNGWRKALRALLEAERARDADSGRPALSATTAKAEEPAKSRSELRVELAKRIAELVVEPVSPVLSAVSDRKAPPRVDVSI